MSTESLLRRFYSGDKYNGTLQFYAWLRQHMTPSASVLNIGAGPATREVVRTIKGEARLAVGIDIDPCVLDNPEFDKVALIENDRFPVGDAEFDLAFSDYVLEHVERPEKFLAEVCRVLKPGGSFLFRTPNLYHYVALVSSATPHWVHDRVANKARRLSSEAHAPYPTFYRLNTRAAIRSAARASGLEAAELRMVEYEPSYLKFSSIAFLAGTAYERTVNSSQAFSGLRANIQGRLIKG